MITRIVRLTLQPDKVKEFESYFKESYSSIRNSEGCTHLELFFDTDEPNVLITFSKWRTADDLEAYRHSEIFRSTWQKVKPLFAASPMAFSMTEK